MPRWVVYLGNLVGLTLPVATGKHKSFQLLFPAWVLLVSVVILFVRPSSRRANEVQSARRVPDLEEQGVFGRGQARRGGRPEVMAGAVS